MERQNRIKTLFRNLLEEFGNPQHRRRCARQIFEGDYAYLIWSGETVDNHYEFATDRFRPKRER